MTALVLALRWSRWLPLWMIRAGAGALAWYAWATRAKAARRLEANLARVTGAEGTALRRLTRRGMASAARYYAELFELPRMTGEAIDARVRAIDIAHVQGILDRDGRVIAVLSHSGNWDLAGAFSHRRLAPVTSVAEVLEPRAAFDEFVRLREELGMTILGHQGSSTFRELIKATRSAGGVIALLADRDMSGSGVPVHMWGHDVHVAAGPSALAVATHTAVVPVMVHYERLSGQRRRRARSRWGIVVTFGAPIEPRPDAGGEQVGEITAAWVQFLADQIAAHPEDWHMLQRFGWTS